MAFPDITAVSFLNESFPAMFHNSIPADANDINAVPNPSHDPQIFVATILTILTTCASIAFAAARHIPRFRYSDKHYNRGFTVLFACSLDFLIMGLVQLMYVNGIDELNTRFPNLTAEPGTSQGLTGASLVCLLVASVAFLQGCTVPQPKGQASDYDRWIRSEGAGYASSSSTPFLSAGQFLSLLILDQFALYGNCQNIYWRALDLFERCTANYMAVRVHSEF
ncbi:hypothetical protein BC936DRAFT_141788 [Jimgerdemannia flammicorona]|uniref:Uncharacterized protein n=1 Tax=Jimgerdemannia flammicorona TaxID=994334 RepID=A0A433DFU1_9FUNG|nr:hypothetical protein BC936DRAFT_141788 [Jimgerdemannia flammicorona]